MKQKAIAMVLSDRVASNDLVILEKFEIKEYKTKVVIEVLKKIEKLFGKTNDSKNQKRSLLIINDKKDEKTKYSARNLAGVKLLNLKNINIVNLLKYRNLVFTKESITKLEKMYK